MAAEEAHTEKNSWFLLRRAGTEGRPVLFVSGPPTSGAIFQRVQERLAPRRSIAIEGLANAESFDAATFSREFKALCEAENVGAVVVHGLALPLVLQSDLAAVELLVLSNGPLRRLDPFTRALSRVPCTVMEKLVLQPRVFNKWLASSVGLRRAVVNPYVMERDVVEGLTAPFLESSVARKQTNRWLKALPKQLPATLPVDTKVVAIWGDKDFLYPVEEVEQYQDLEVINIPGGRFLHPQERPWELADACREMFEKLGV